MISPEHKVEKMIPNTEEKWREGVEEEAHVGDGKIDNKEEKEETRGEAEEEKGDVIDEDDKEKKKVKEAQHPKNKRAKKAGRTKGQKQPGQLNLNNEVVCMRKEMKRVRVLLIRKLTRQIAVLKKKKGNEVAIERNQKRAARLLDEIHAMKALQLDLVTKTALQKTLNFDQVCRNPKSTMADRAVARIASHPQFSKRIEDIKAAVKAFQAERVKGEKQGEKHQNVEKEDGEQSPVKRADKVAKGATSTEEVEENDDSEEQERQHSQAPTPSMRPASVKRFEVKEPARKKPQAKSQENKLQPTHTKEEGESDSEILDQDGTVAAKPVPKPTLRKQDDKSNSEVSDNSNFDGTVAAKPVPQTKQGDQSDLEISEDDKSDLDVSTVAAKPLLKPTLGKQDDKSDPEVSDNSDIDSTVAAKPMPQTKQGDQSDSEISEDDKSDLDDSTVAAKQLLKPTLGKQDDQSDSEISDDEDKPYFDDSTEERFHKQSSQSESDSDNDFFVGKVSKFKKKKKEKEGVKVQSVKEETSKPVDKIQSELDELESRLKAKAPKLQTVFCSLSQSKPSRGRGGNSFRGRGKPTGRGNGDDEKHSRFQKEERGTAALKYNKNPETRRFRSEEATFRGRGRGSNPRQQDRRGGFSHQAPQQALHPSWEASKKRKEQQGQILAFQGKKIKFDDDD
ncbi:serum response factor-binding protein 1 [Nerophis lumbriciformis]|uniref:serum response factor-binding protein 1 n=1 Tax=Nerophis lumbriciformis TaxID=546530 RepID=UPI003BACBA24